MTRLQSVSNLPQASRTGRWPRFGRTGMGLALLALAAGCERRIPTGPLPQSDVALEIRAALASNSSGDSSAAPVATGTGWATLTGKFTLAPGATVRAPQALQVNKDQAVCSPGGKPVYDEVMLVDPATRGIANVTIYLRKASRVHDSAKATEDEVIFDQEDCRFKDHIFPLQVGQTMVLKNSDPVGHNTNISQSGMNGLPTNTLIPANQTVDFKPTAEENVPISTTCSIHPWMKAYVLPRNNGYFAVTKPDGTFTIENVPAGEDLEFQVWHENAAGANGGLEASFEGQTWNKGRLKLKLDENETKTMDVVVPGSAFNG